MDCVIDRNESNLIENTEQTEVLNIVQIKPFLLSYNTVCKLLGIERNALRRLMKKDDRFPKPLKWDYHVKQLSILIGKKLKPGIKGLKKDAEVKMRKFKKLERILEVAKKW